MIIVVVIHVVICNCFGGFRVFEVSSFDFRVFELSSVRVVEFPSFIVF
jgi:hypothetical protein